MARIRKPCVVVTFSSTHEALAAEEAVKGHGLAGRLIPVPVAISAGCGLALKLEPASWKEFESLPGIPWQGRYDMEL